MKQKQTTKPIKKRVYIAGPMSGMPGLNFQAFNQLADYIRGLGYIVINPAELSLACGHDTGKPESIADRTRYLLHDLQELAVCDAIVMMPGYATSSGALAEMAFANALGIPVVIY